MFKNGFYFPLFQIMIIYIKRTKLDHKLQVVLFYMRNETHLARKWIIFELYCKANRYFILHVTGPDAITLFLLFYSDKDKNVQMYIIIQFEL